MQYITWNAIKPKSAELKSIRDRNAPTPILKLEDDRGALPDDESPLPRAMSKNKRRREKAKRKGGSGGQSVSDGGSKKQKTHDDSVDGAGARADEKKTRCEKCFAWFERLKNTPFVPDRGFSSAPTFRFNTHDTSKCRKVPEQVERYFAAMKGDVGKPSGGASGENGKKQKKKFKKQKNKKEKGGKGSNFDGQPDLPPLSDDEK